MKATIFKLVFFINLVNAFPSFSQENESLKFEVGASGGFFLYDELGWGYGANGKILFPLFSGDYITTGIAYDRLTEKSKYSDRVYHYSFLNAEVGYRAMHNSFFFEPKAGGGLYNEDGYKAFNFFLGVETGFQLDKTTLSFNFRYISADGFVFGERFAIFSMKAAFRF